MPILGDGGDLRLEVDGGLEGHNAESVRGARAARAGHARGTRATRAGHGARGAGAARARHVRGGDEAHLGAARGGEGAERLRPARALHILTMWEGPGYLPRRSRPAPSRPLSGRERAEPGLSEGASRASCRVRAAVIRRSAGQSYARGRSGRVQVKPNAGLGGVEQKSQVVEQSLRVPKEFASAKYKVD